MISESRGTNALESKARVANKCQHHLVIKHCQTMACDTGGYFVVYILQNVLFWLGLCTCEGHLFQISHIACSIPETDLRSAGSNESCSLSKN